MGKILHRRLALEQMTYGAIAFMGFGFIVVSGRLMQLARHDLFSAVLDWQTFFRILILLLPVSSLYIFPMATLVGTLFTFLRLNGDNELMVLRSAGIRIRRLWPSVLVVSLMATLIALFSAVNLLPRANAALRAEFDSLKAETAGNLFQAGTFIDQLPGFVFFFDRVQPQAFSARGVFIKGGGKKKGFMIVAESLHLLRRPLTQALVLKISNGVLIRSTPGSPDAQQISFGSYYVPLFQPPTAEGEPSKTKGLMSLGELHRAYLDSRHARWALEFHKRMALPAACLAMGFIGALLGAGFKGEGRAVGLVLSLTVFIGYYLLLALGAAMASKGWLPPAIGIWGADLAAAGLAFFFWSGLDNRVELGRGPGGWAL